MGKWRVASIVGWLLPAEQLQRRQYPQTSVYKSFAETAHRRPTIGSQRAEASRSQCSSTEQTNHRHTDYIFALLSEYHCLWGHSRCCVVLQGLSFAVFGLGNRQYEHFAAVGKRLQKALAALGATPVCRRGDGDDDDDIDADFEAWQAELLTALDKSPLMPAPKVRRCCYRRFREFGRGYLLSQSLHTFRLITSLTFSVIRCVTRETNRSVEDCRLTCMSYRGRYNPCMSRCSRFDHLHAHIPA